MSVRVIVIFAMCLSATSFAESPEPDHHTVIVDGHPVAVWEKSAPNADDAILLVHGRTWSARPDYDLQVEGEDLSLMDGLVAQGFAVFALDMRGYGSTPRDATGWLTPNRAADDVAAVASWIARERTGNMRPNLFGWSMGSTISQLAVQRYPDEFSSLTLFGYWRDVDAILPADELDIVPLNEANTAAAAASDFITPDSISQNAIDTFVRTALSTDPVRVDAKSSDHYNALDESKIDLPTLVIAGALDPIAPIEFQLKLIARLGTDHKQLVLVPGGDHAAFLESPRDYFLRELIAFLRGVDQ